ncbi:mannose 6-phosphate receptor domain-containing protein [Thozetella sp. PMI_491]|nr:mannose 6-phosphate receptor domain-containing protein [Thozetella sp. PMI_491]
MIVRRSPGALLIAVLAATVLAADSTTLLATASSTSSTSTSSATVEATPCVAHSQSGAFFDLRPDTAIILEKDKKAPKNAQLTDYTAKGYDLNYDFTLNICGAVVKPVEKAVDVPSSLHSNISAYYEKDGKVYSLGLQSSKLVSRGRKLVLQYTGGSPCATDKSDKRDAVHDGARYNKYYDEDSEETSPKGKVANKETTKTKDTDKEKDKGDTTRRKSATISFLCDRDPLNTHAAASFVGVDPDECAYFFEVRSQHACAGAEPHKPGSVGPGSVFAIIFFIAVLVYLVGGVFYQRTVGHARGWRQLPNYSLWSSIWNFFNDMLTILLSSCARCFPSRRGYRALSISPSRRNRNREDENRLIDQLDEEWDD